MAQMNRTGRNARTTWAVALASGGLATLTSAQTPYRLVDLGVIYGESEAFGIGNGGMVVGLSSGADSHFLPASFGPASAGNGATALPRLAGFAEHAAFTITGAGVVYGTAYNLGEVEGTAFMVDGPIVTSLGTFDARDANASGTVVGTQTITTSGLRLPRACRYASGTLETLPTLGGLLSRGLGVDSGSGASARVVGSSSTAAETGQRPCVWVGSTPHELGTLGGAEGQARAIRSDLVVGHSQLASGVIHATSWTVNASGGVTQKRDLGASGAGNTSYALDVNAGGDIVGTSGFHAMLWPSDQAPGVDLNTVLGTNSPWVLEKAWAISDDGTIVGRGTKLGFPRAYALVPGCVADIDDGAGTGTPDGGVTIDDLLYYIEILDAGSIAADVDNGSSTGTPDGGVTIDDLLYFIARFNAGC